MKATETRILDFLKKSTNFTIPIYQRTYSWLLPQCEQLWDDIMAVGASNGQYAHFLGSVVYIQEDMYQVSSTPSLHVIDGQQRLTTITLLLIALSRYLGSQGSVGGMSAEKIRAYYLLNTLEDGDLRYRLILTETDKKSLIALLENQTLPDTETSLRIQENFEFFYRKIGDNNERLEQLYTGISKLFMVDISLTRGQDNPQLIFESMNSTGKALSQADLIRNYILMGLEKEKQTRLYNQYWRPIEKQFGQQSYDLYFDAFMRHYLTVKIGEIPRLNDVYDTFKRYSFELFQKDTDIEEIVKDIARYADFYCKIAFVQETDKQLIRAFRNLRDLKVDVVYPMLLEVYGDYSDGLLNKNDFVGIVELIESYVFRRAICAIPTNSMNKTFCRFMRSMDKTQYLESVKIQFALLTSYRRFPSDEEFMQDLKVRDVYNSRINLYWLKRMETHGRKELPVIEEHTIEHIMPQNPNLSEKWRSELGDDWKGVQKKWLHTIGNLTLTGYNSEYSDRPFHEKQNMEGGFKHSPLKLNDELRLASKWDEHAIISRAEVLAKKAIQVWPHHLIGDEIIALHSTDVSVTQSEYTVESYPYIAHEGTARTLFDQLSQTILEIDDLITIEYLKRYIAFKAETNIVDIVPRKNTLNLTVNMPFADLDDPKGIARDVSSIGRWGNGEVGLELSKAEDIPYILGLIKQSFYRQIG